ncbi:xanthine dehydrogenase family protein subunit M [Treponema sp. C6A8]|uniref:FAD binding domain-containing protein n=1 Tax=Treponema sp. C6A8 TaxID=1410609 RepID=UPI000485328A|nr:FAD binding domain-containing protein [Treponema sp. C6A8]
MIKQMLYAKNPNELLTLLKNNQGAKIVGGCTGNEDFPSKAISIKQIKDFNHITRHERFLTVGPGVTLNQLLGLGQNHLPQILYEALSSIANPIIRNMATIGGNILSSGQKHTLYAPLMALDAKLDFKNLNESYSESILSFKNLPQGSILTSIRIPLLDSDLSIFRRIGPEQGITELSASFAFLAKIEKNSLLSVRLTFAGPFTFHSKEFENSLVGKRLPLSQKDVSQICEDAAVAFKKTATDKMISDVMKQQFFNLTRYSFEQLT